MHIGRRNTAGIGFELTPGTAVEPTHYFEFLTCNLQERHTPIPDTQAKGLRDAEGSQSVEGKKWGEGTVEAVLDPTTAPYWFGLALGTITTSGSYKHTITQSQENEPLTATIWRDRNVDEVHFPSTVLGSMELNFADDIAKITANLMSKYPVDQSRTATHTELKYYTFRNASVETGAGEIKVRELTLNIDNDPELIYAPGDNDVDRIAWKSFRVSGSFTLLFESEVQKDAFKDLTKQALTITFEGDGTDKIEITIPKFRVDSWEEDPSLDDISQETISFVAERDADETIEVIVDNDVEEYIPTS